MSDTTYRVRTVYDADTEKAEAKVGRVSATLARIGGAFDSAAATVARFGAIGVGLGASFAVGLGAVGTQIARIGSQAEDAQVVIAGMMRANDVGDNWGDAMSMAQGAMAQIRRDAAVLPGEAEDFVRIFQASLPKALEAGLTNPQAISQFTNRVGAVGISFGIDSDQIGRDLNLMLSGRAGASVRTWSALSNSIAQAGRELHLNATTAEAFNDLKPEQRLDLINRATGRYSEMIGAFANTWSAQASTFTSTLRDLARVGTAPLFERMKATLIEINGWFSQNEAKINTMVVTVGTRLANAFDRVHDWVIRNRDGIVSLARAVGGGLVTAFERVAAIVTRVRETLDGTSLGDLASKAGGIGGALAMARGGLAVAGGPAAATVGGAFGGGAAAGAGVIGAALLGPIAALATGAVNPADLLRDMEAAGRPLVVAFGDLATAVGPLVIAIGQIQIGAFREFLGVFQQLGTVIQGVTGIVRSISTTIQSELASVVRGANNTFSMSITQQDWSIVPRTIAAMLVAQIPLVGGFLSAAISANGVSSEGAERGSIPNGEDTEMLGFNGTNYFRQQERFRRPAPRARAAASPGKHTVHVKIEQTIHDASDPDRVLIETKRAIRQAVQFPLESPTSGAQVLR